MSEDLKSQFIYVMLVEDDATYQQAFQAAIQAASDMRLAATACNKAQALVLLDGRPPDVLVVDLGLPDGSGLDVIREAHAHWPACAIMVSTVFTDERLVIECIEAGAIGYLLKYNASGNIAEEIRTLHAGGSPISPLIARQILARLRFDGKPFTHAASIEPSPTLSAREQETLNLIARGLTYDGIASRMGVSRNTVMTFIRRIYAKLEVNTRTASINEGRRLGLLEN